MPEIQYMQQIYLTINFYSKDSDMSKVIVFLIIFHR